MKPFFGTALASALALACITIHADEVLSPAQVSEKVTIQNLRQEGAAIRGEIVNHTGKRLEDVQVLISFNWLWRNEFAPGPESPGWASSMVLAEPLSPNETREFAYAPVPSVTSRVDGKIQPAADVVRFTEITQR